MNKGHSPIYSHDCGMNRTFLFLKIENSLIKRSYYDDKVL